MLATAAGMFGPGFVWLVQDHNPNPNHPSVASAAAIDRNKPPLHFRLLSTYVAGTPYPGAHFRQQANPNTVGLSADEFYKQTTPQNRVGYRVGMGSIPLEDDTQSTAQRYGGATITPVLCVSTWPQTYLREYGVAGKRQYLIKWWERINWSHVWSNCIDKGPPRNRSSFMY